MYLHCHWKAILTTVAFVSMHIGSGSLHMTLQWITYSERLERAFGCLSSPRCCIAAYCWWDRQYRKTITKPVIFILYVNTLIDSVHHALVEYSISATSISILKWRLPSLHVALMPTAYEGQMLDVLLEVNRATKSGQMTMFLAPSS